MSADFTETDSYDSVYTAKIQDTVGNGVYKEVTNQRGTLYIDADYSEKPFTVTAIHSASKVESFQYQPNHKNTELITARILFNTLLNGDVIDIATTYDTLENYSNGQQIIYDCSKESCSKKFIDSYLFRENEWYPHQPINQLEGEINKNVTDVGLKTDPGNYILEPINEYYQLQETPVELDSPWDIAVLPNGKLLITEQEGSIQKINLESWSQEKIDFSGNYSIHDTHGLLGIEQITLEDENLVYLFHNIEDDDFNASHRVFRYILEDGELKDEEIIVDSIPGSKYHSGGRISIGPDNKLYISTGDAHRMHLVDDKSSLAGKILRVNLDGSIPETNPYDNKVYAKGLRNPQGFDWHPENNDLTINEHGFVHNDAVHLSGRGVDHGWWHERCNIEFYNDSQVNIDSFRDSYMENWGIKLEEVNQDRNSSKPIYCTYDWTLAPSGATYVDAPKTSLHGTYLVAGLRGNHIHHLEIRNGEVKDSYIGGFRTDKNITERYRHIEQIKDKLYVLGDRGNLYYAEIPSYSDSR